jgi:lipopolysaccharide/colanic/teichoic acid biosynthesis glycosyltransferase
MQIADLELLCGGAPTKRKRDRVDDGSRPDAEQTGSAPTSGQAGQDLPRPFELAATAVGGEQVLAQTTFADEFSALLFSDPLPRLLAMKRTVDIVLSAVALIVLLPFFAILGALIKLTSPGPVFFAQRRVGHQGRIFKMLKFRSMVIDAEELKPRLADQNESNGPVFKMRRDPRVTAIGRFMRKYSLDELPQLINVLLGEMSMVGPRPPVPSEVLRYEPWQYRRFAVRPGLTCVWQVSPERYQISFDDWIRLDLSYIDHWTLRLDFELILLTFGVVLRGTGQ